MTTAPGKSGDRGTLTPTRLAQLLTGGPPGAPAWTWFGGHVFGVVGDLEPLRLLFEVEGCAVTVMPPSPPDRLTVALRQVTLYRDPATRRPVDRWQNPYTRQELAVAHEHLPHVEADLARLQAPVHWLGVGDTISVFLDDHAANHFPLRPHDAGASAARRATSSAQLVTARSGLLDQDAAADFVGAWQLLVDWPQWLAMGTQPGYLFQRVFVRKTSQREQVPAALRREIVARFPDGLAPPTST
ncbi:MAG: DUF1838 domain-containing protein [Gammaproteobacteria bacterium]|nr:DUF1838 domain-containing protein [Gammaproteobacteria bacterium]